MKTLSVHHPHRGNAGFTMVEIAICIAVVAFAMVAIMGVMPTGFEVQKRNREDTIINQEGMFWLEAIRGGAQGLDDLTNYVDVIRLEGTAVKGPEDLKFRQFPALSFTRDTVGRTGNGFRTGRDIIGLLSYPRYLNQNGMQAQTTRVFAYVRALNGMAAEKALANDFAFTYRLTSELVPFSPIGHATPAQGGFSTNFSEFSLTDTERAARSNLFVRVQRTMPNLYELRLRLEWPVYTRNNQLTVGDRKKVFRTLVGGSFSWTNVSYMTQRQLFFLQDSEFVYVQ